VLVTMSRHDLPPWHGDQHADHHPADDAGPPTDGPDTPYRL